MEQNKNNQIEEEEIVQDMEEKINQEEINEQNEAQPEEKKPCDCVEHEKIHDCKCTKKRSDNSVVNKNEGLIMFVVTALIICACFFSLQTSITGMIDEFDAMTNYYESQINTLKIQISNLEDKLDEYHIEEMNKDINVNICTNGLKNEAEQTEPTEVVKEFDARPFLGVGFFEGNDGSANPIGIQVDYVYPFSPAEFAGMKAGDIIMAVNDVAIDTFTDLDAVMNQCKANDTIKIAFATVSENGIAIVNVNTTLTYRGNFNLGD